MKSSFFKPISPVMFISRKARASMVSISILPQNRCVHTFDGTSMRFDWVVKDPSASVIVCRPNVIVRRQANYSRKL